MVEDSSAGVVALFSVLPLGVVGEEPLPFDVLFNEPLALELSEPVSPAGVGVIGLSVCIDRSGATLASVGKAGVGSSGADDDDDGTDST